MRRRARLEIRGELPDGAGGFEEGWTLVAHHWVALLPASGAEAYEGAQLAPTVTHRVLCRATRALRPRADMRWVVAGRPFDIRAVFDRDGRGRMLTTLCEERET